MPLFLLLLGAVTALIGLALVASGVAMRDAFDSDVITPGTIAAVGGLLLIGIGLTVREIQRLVLAVAGQPFIKEGRQSRGPHAPESLNGAGRLVLPPIPAARSDLLAMSGPAALAAESDNTAPRRREAAHATGHFETTHIDTPHSDASAGELGAAPSFFQGANGAAAPPALPRLVAKSNQPAAANGAGGRGIRGVLQSKQQTELQSPARQTPAARQRVTMPVPRGEEHAVADTPALGEVPSHEAPPPITVLKSGIIEGMAYTLYSDGSIEAELPQGKLRFGSITALRDHIEGAA